jgi:hypothetical protein
MGIKIWLVVMGVGNACYYQADAWHVELQGRSEGNRRDVGRGR